VRQPIPHRNAPRILIVIPGGHNYFYDAVGQRFWRALRNIGCEADICTLQTYQPKEYDLTIYSTLAEVVGNYYASFRTDPMKLISAINQRTTQVAVVSLECVETQWFDNVWRVAAQAGVSAIYDVGFLDQSYKLASSNIQVDYRFIFNSLTQNEREKVQHSLHVQAERPIPWAYIGHRLNSQRLQLAQALLSRLGSDGVFYLPGLRGPLGPDSPHFNAKQLRRLLEKTRYYIWISHHNYFYIESERFRDAALAGCVPIKLQSPSALAETINFPFNYLMISEVDFDDHLRTLDYERLRQRFLKDYLAKPSLEVELAQKVLQVR